MPGNPNPALQGRSSTPADLSDFETVAAPVAGGTGHRVLVVEDSEDLARGLCENLLMEGYEAEAAHDGEEALELVARSEPALVILDLMLPRMDGFRFLAEFRRRGFTTPVLILSARSQQTDKLRGFRLGADDYVTKPFDLFELLARVDAILRRSAGAATGEGRIEFGEVTLDVRARTVHRDGDLVDLSPKELDLAIALIQRAGTAVSREQLLREVWEHKAAIRTRTVDTHMLQLRKKLERDPGSPEHFRTVPKVGYRFDY